MRKEVVKTKNAPAPGGWYSQAIISSPFVFVSGCVGVNPETGKLEEPGDIKAQTDRVMKNISAILKEAGSSMENIVKTTVFVDNIGKFVEFNDVYKKYFKDNPPARSTVQVGDFMEGMCIEIEAIARLNN